MDSKGTSGLNKHYRDLYERVYRQQENRGIARIKAEFDRYIEAFWPGILDPARITRIKLSPRIRNIISKKQAASILGSRLERVASLVQQGKLTPVIFKGKAHYLRDQVEALAASIDSNWTMAEACEAFQLTRYQLRQLLDTRILRALQKPNYLNRDWVIDKAQCQEVAERLGLGARNTRPVGRVMSMAAIQRKGYSITRLVVAMQSGELEYGMVPDIQHPWSLKRFLDFQISEAP